MFSAGAGVFSGAGVFFAGAGAGAGGEKPGVCTALFSNAQWGRYSSLYCWTVV